MNVTDQTADLSVKLKCDPSNSKFKPKTRQMCHANYYSLT